MVVQFVKLSSGEHKELAELSCIEGSVANKLLPGLDVSPDNLVLHIAEGLNIHPLRYLQVGVYVHLIMYFLKMVNANLFWNVTVGFQGLMESVRITSGA